MSVFGERERERERERESISGITCTGAKGKSDPDMHWYSVKSNI